MNWRVVNNKLNIEYLPIGEESFHAPSVVCLCRPLLSKTKMHKLMIIHNAFDGRDVFDAHADSPLHRVRPGRDV